MHSSQQSPIVQGPRCKPGDRARIISSTIPENVGKVVVVVRPYQRDELIDGFLWNCNTSPWVAVCIGSHVVSLVGADRLTQMLHMTTVVDDARLMPLRDDEGGVEGSTIMQTKNNSTLEVL